LLCGSSLAAIGNALPAVQAEWGGNCGSMAWPMSLHRRAVRAEWPCRSALIAKLARKIFLAEGRFWRINRCGTTG